MFKKWLAVLGAVVLVVCAFELLWAVGGNGDSNGDEHSWGVTNGETESSVNSTTVTRPGKTFLIRFYIVRPAPMGGFYLIRVSLPSDAFGKTAAGSKKTGN